MLLAETKTFLHGIASELGEGFRVAIAFDGNFLWLNIAKPESGKPPLPLKIDDADYGRALREIEREVVSLATGHFQC